jgi:uncharacterized protein YhaN
MRIAAVELQDLRRFAGRWRVGPFAPGLNVLAAPNEAGKSTLLAAIQAAIFLPHRSTAAAEDLRPLAGGVPEVRLTLDAAAGAWVIHKRFAGRGGRAEVVAPDGRTLAGDAAEEAIRGLFGVAPESRQREVPRGVWGALWVEQGHSFDLSRLDDPARRTLRRALEAEVGTVTGAAGIARLRRAIADELAKLQTPTGRQPAGRLRALRDQADRCERELAELRQRRAEVEADLARLDALLAERQRRRDARIEQTLTEARRAAEERLSALERAANERKAALDAAESAERLAEAAQRELEARQRDRDAVCEAEAAADEAREAAEAARRGEREAQRALLRAEGAAATAAATCSRQHAETLAQVAERLRRAEEAEAATRRARPRIEAAVAGGVVLALAAAALVALPLVLPRLATGLSWGAAAVLLLGAAVLVARAARRRAAGRRALADAAAELGAARAAAEALAPGIAIAEAVAAAQAEARQAEARAHDLAARIGEAAAEAEPPLPVGTAREAAAAAAREAERRAAEAEAKTEAARQLAARLDEARAREADDRLAERVRLSHEQATRHKERAAALAAPTPEARSAAKIEIERCEKALKAAQDEDRRIAEQIAGIQGGLARIEAEGIDERIDAADGERDRLRREIDQLEARRAALNLLDETLAQAEQEATASWLEPVARTLASWLDALIPGARATLDETTLQPSGLSRGGRDETFDILSAGTREQIAVLVRLAFAEILHRQGRPALVILDDALVFSDDDRIARMFDILSAASERMQIVVLTCRTGLFSRLGGHRLVLERVA